jgi:hypothetical protein
VDGAVDVAGVVSGLVDGALSEVDGALDCVVGLGEEDVEVTGAPLATADGVRPSS